MENLSGEVSHVTREKKKSNGISVSSLDELRLLSRLERSGVIVRTRMDITALIFAATPTARTIGEHAGMSSDREKFRVDENTEGNDEGGVPSGVRTLLDRLRRIVLGRHPVEPRVEQRRIAAGLAMLTALSWARFMATGRLSLSGFGLAPAQWLWFGPTFGLAWILCGRAILRLISFDGPEVEDRNLFRGSLILHATVLLAIPLTSNDVLNYLSIGRLEVRGQNPYLTPTTALPADDPFAATTSFDTRQETLPYGPIGLFYGWIGARTGSVWLGLVAIKVLAIGLWCGVIFVLRAMARRSMLSRRGLLLLAWNPLVAWETTGQLHNDIVIVVAMIGAVGAMKCGRATLGWLAVALGMATKFVLAPFAGLLAVVQLREHGWRALPGITLGALVLIGLFAPWWSGPETLHGPIMAMRPERGYLTGSLAQLVWGRFPKGAEVAPSAAFDAWVVVTRVVLVLAAARLAWRARSIDDAARGALVFGMIWLPLGVEWMLPWYGLWLLAWLPFVRARALQVGVVVYAAGLPWLYAPDAIERALVLPTVALHAVPLAAVAWSYAGRPDPGEPVSPA